MSGKHRRSSSGSNVKKHVYVVEGMEFVYHGNVDDKKFPEGRGELIYPGGDCVYEGSFHGGMKVGMGKIIWKDSSFSFGMWKDDLPCSDQKFKIRYENGDEYFGYVKIRKGKEKSFGKVLLGISKVKKGKKGGNGSSLAYHVDDFQKHGPDGEYFFQKENVKYHGNFENNRRKGFGICIYYGIEERYYGEWERGLYHGNGTYIFADGSFYVGHWKNGFKNGKGTFFLSNGDAVDGVFKKHQLTHGRFIKGSLSNVSLPLIHLQSIRIKKHLGRADDFLSDSQQQQKPITIRKWDYLFNRPKLGKELLTLDVGLDEFRTPSSLYEHLKKKFEELLRDKDGYLHYLINVFSNGFQVCYITGVKKEIKRTLIPHAVDDVFSFIRLFEETSQELFENVTPLRRALKLFKSVISNVIHSKIYDSFYPLYQVEHEEKDLLLKEKIKMLDIGLIAVGVPEHFSPSKEQQENPYEKSIRLLEQLKMKRNANEKLLILGKFREVVMEEMREILGGKEHVKKRIEGISADDLTPIYAYCFTKARFSDLYAQFHYIRDWVDLTDPQFDHIISVFCFFEGFFKYILSLDPNLKHKNGLLISTYQIEVAVENAIKDQERRRKKRRYHFLWIPNLLIAINKEVGSYSHKDNTKIILKREQYRNLILTLEEAGIEEVNEILCSSKNIGFRVEMTDEKDMIIFFTTLYPAHIYQDIAVKTISLLKLE